MPAVKSLDRASKKWTQRASVSQEAYTDGIDNPRVDWAAATQAANQAYKSGITQSLAADRFAAGVKKAGTSKWADNAKKKGPGRWSEGVAMSTDAYEKGFSPYRQVIEATNLPPRGPKGDPNNIKRVSLLAEALHKKKVAMGS